MSQPFMSHGQMTVYVTSMTVYVTGVTVYVTRLIMAITRCIIFAPYFDTLSILLDYSVLFLWRHNGRG